MFALALAVVGASASAVEATGMKPQLRVVEQLAAKRGWPITCVGRAGEETVVRIGLPSGTSREALDAFTEAAMSAASSVTILPEDAPDQKCDRTPVRAEGSGSIRTLMFTKGQRDVRLLTMAKECGFPKATWRSSRAGDFATLQGRLDPRDYTTVLDARQDASKRYGGLICFLNMGLRPFLKQDH